MPDSWTRALNLYCYPVDLRAYRRSHEFPGFFEMLIQGDRTSTMAFENRFRETAPNHIAAFLEVVFWKLFSQGGRRDIKTDNVKDHVQRSNILPKNLWNAVLIFLKDQNLNNLRSIRTMLGFTAPVLATTLTFPAFAHPDTFPMVDTRVAKWVNEHFQEGHNINKKYKLTNFNYNGQGVLTENDFTNYLHWVGWCRETSEILTRQTGEKWRARDVEMAVFTAQDKKIGLNPLKN
ncbi:MAG: hypothetical protein FJ126_05675 [Deltaproteobacteria bacterium]|nr:hypothetical protein [Deltaproteobacteria bacterium]